MPPRRLRRAAPCALLLLAAFGCRPSVPLDPQKRARRREADFFDYPEVLTRRRGLKGSRRVKHYLQIWPRLLLAGKRRVKVALFLEDLDFRPGDYRFAPGDRFEIVGEGGRALPLKKVRARRGKLLGVVPRVPDDAPGYKRLVIDQTARGGARHGFDFAFRVVDKVRVALTFDDGPAACGDPADGECAGSPTARVLEALAGYRHGPKRSRKGVKAAFFVLTGPDRFMGTTYPKGETEDGRRLLARMEREGHVVAAHWGGPYGKQKYRHISRVDCDGDGADDDGDGRADEDKPYDCDGDGRADGASALESDLLQCIGRIQAVTGRRPEFVRPPLWSYRRPGHPEVEGRVLAAYRRLGLKPVLTDAKLGDGGYAIIGFFVSQDRMLKKGLRRAIAAGHAELVVTMHDSNETTAGDLHKWLRRIERTLGGVRLGGRRLDVEREVSFAASRGELLKVLRSKRRYASDLHLVVSDTSK